MTNSYDPHTMPDPSLIQRPICDKIVTYDLSGDFSLPDYQPEIKRLLRIETSVLPPERYMSREHLDLSGSMDYFVLYTGNDDQLYCAPLSTDYQISIPLDDERNGYDSMSSLSSEDITCTCHIAADPVTGRVTAPRRLNIKCRLTAKAKAYAPVPVAATDSDTAGADTELLWGHIKSARLYQGVGEMLSLQDDVILSPGDNREMRVVCAEGRVMVTETTSAMNMVTCRGDVLLKLTLCPTDPPDGELAAPVLMTRKIPFSQAIDIAGVTPDCSSCAHGACSEMSVEVEEGQLHADLGIILEVLAQKNQVTPYVKDIYSPQRENDCIYATYPVEEALKCFNGNFTLSDSLPLSEVGISPAARVIDVAATAFPESIFVSQGKCVLTGRCRAHMILSREGEYSSASFELPFKYESDSGLLATDLDSDSPITPDFDAEAQAVSCRARMDGERVGIDAELAIMLRSVKKEEMTALSGVSYGEKVVRRCGEYVICFPAPTDTLWTVAKRYHAPLAALSAANNLPLPEAADKAGSLDGIDYLIV